MQFTLMVTEQVTYRITANREDLEKELNLPEGVDITPATIMEYLDVDSPLIADGCCAANVSKCEERAIVEVTAV